MPIDNHIIVNATKWSAIAEVLAKLITPITSMVLARLLTPDAFGVVATITMIISFAEIFTDAGFQKYVIQHEFVNDDDRDESTNVAFWSNLALAFILWGIIAIFNEPLAELVGNPGLGHVITIASASLPLQAFSSIQMANYKRDLDFKTLFKVRITGVLVPLVVTIPLAFIMHSYWALVIGTIAVNLVNAFVLTIYSTWRPKWYYSWVKLREMLSFTIWSIIESVSIWLTNYIDIFIVGIALSQYYLGLYKTSMTTVAQITTLITAATTPVLFSSLSRLQDNRQEFEQLFFRFQKLVGIMIIPLGVGIYVFRNFITLVLLGSQWMDAADFIGLWGLTSAVTIVLAHYSSEVYRALGKPRLSVLAQVLHIVVLWPVVKIGVQYGFDTLCFARAMVRMELVLVQLLITYFVVKLSPIDMIKNVFPEIIASTLMGGVGLALLSFDTSVIWTIFSIFICVIIYFAIILAFKRDRHVIVAFIKNLWNK